MKKIEIPEEPFDPIAKYLAFNYGIETRHSFDSLDCAVQLRKPTLFVMVLGMYQDWATITAKALTFAQVVEYQSMITLGETQSLDELKGLLSLDPSIELKSDRSPSDSKILGQYWCEEHNNWYLISMKETHERICRHTKEQNATRT